MQQMPGRDAYLDGLLVFATRAHARGGIVTRPKQTLESRSSRARTLAPDVKPCRDKRVRVRARFVRPRLLASSFASSNEPYRTVQWVVSPPR